MCCQLHQLAARCAVREGFFMTLPKVAIVAVNDFGPFQLAVPCAIFGNFLPGIGMFD